MWAAGPEHAPGRQRRAGRPPRGHRRPGRSAGASTPASRCPTGARAAALSIPVAEALGWLVAVGGGLGRRRRRRRASPGSAGSPSPPCASSPAAPSCPTLRSSQAARTAARSTCAVRWAPALRRRRGELDALAAAMPGPVAALSPPPTPGPSTLDVLGAVVDAIVADAAGRLELPAPPPATRTAADGRRGRRHPARRLGVRGARSPPAPRCPSGSTAGPSPSPAPAAHASSCSSTRPTAATPGSCRCSGPAPTGGLLPIEVALADSQADQAARRRAGPPRAAPAPCCCAPAACAAARCTSSQAEAWELMTVTGAAARGGRLRRAGPGAVPPQAVAGAAPVHRARRRHRSSAPTSSATCAGRRCSTTSS